MPISRIRLVYNNNQFYEVIIFDRDGNIARIKRFINLDDADKFYEKIEKEHNLYITRRY